MIGESLYFSFDEIKSTNFPIANIKVGQGAFSESLSTGKQINESYPINSFKPYFMGVQKEVKEFDVSFVFLEPWNDEMMDEILQWLSVDEYKKMYFESNIDRVFYAMPITDIGLIHNGLQQGYLTITFRCDSAYSYSHEKATVWYDATVKDVEFNIRNLGYYNVYPEIEIIKVGNGNVSIYNKSNANQQLRFTSLKDGEKIVIDCFNEEIETSLEDTFRFDDFNDVYIELLRGDNMIRITGRCYVRFNYQYLYS